MRIYPATRYQIGAISSTGKASNMLLRQYQFPDEYFEPDKHTQVDHDRLLSWDHAHTTACFEKHTKRGELSFQSWINIATDQQILEFLIEVMKADPTVKWTGYRVTGTVNRGNGFPVWGLELFAKHPNTRTVLYTGENAPNVR